MRRTRERNERAAVAVIVALTSFVLLGVAALAVDLGNAFVRERDVVSWADFAALAGGADLSGATSEPLASDPAVQSAARYLFYNQPQNDAVSPALTQAELAVALTDADTADGQAYYGHLGPGGAFVASNVELTVRTPPTLVRFGLASVFGFDATAVRASATVRIGTPGQSVLPVYAVSGCDYGPQTITDPANGQVTTTGPTLAYPADSNRATLTSVSPAQVGSNPGTGTVTISGTGLTGVTGVGFFQDGNGSPGPNPSVYPLPQSNTNDTTIAVPLPIADVTNTETVWWVRVFGPAQTNKPANEPGQWSAVGSAQPLRVGEAVLRCAGVSNEGNYGTLRLPRTDVNDATTNGWLPTNLALGLQSPLTLHTYPGSPSSPGAASSAPDLCSPDDPRTVYSSTTGTPTLLPGTNCVDTDTGLPANAVSAGLIEGTSGPASAGGRLRRPTTANCAPDGTSSSRTVTLAGNRSYSINDDVLTCFFTNSATTIEDIAKPSYAGPPVIAPAIYSSPRFFWQPVLQTKPGSGGSLRYSIVDFRPAFLTDQALSATKPAPQVNEGNGIKVANGAVSEVSVVFFNANALPTDDAGSIGPYLGGTTPKVVQLVD